jgi:hypothetical protein
MTTRTWIGGRGNNQVSNPNNWSPNGHPQPGDDLTVTHGTVNITGDQLPDADVLNVTGPATININHATGDHLRLKGDGATINMLNSDVDVVTYPLVGIPDGKATINAFGNNQLDVSTFTRFGGADVTVNNYGTIRGGALQGFGNNITVNGATWNNDGPSTAGYDGMRFIANTDVTGTGSFTVGSFHATGKYTGLEFTKSVGAGQIIKMDSGQGFAAVEVDDTSRFNAAIDWGFTTTGDVKLHNLAADSYSKHDGVLDFFHGDSLVKSIRFNETHPEVSGEVHVSQIPGGVEIHSTSFFQAFGPDLPQHIAIAA